MSRNETFDAAAVIRLEVNLAWATLEVTADRVDRIQLIVAGTPEDVEDLRAEADNGVLRVEQPAYGLSTRINTERWMQVTLRIPEDWKGEAACSTMAGLLRCRGLTGTDFSFSTISGSLRASQIGAMTLSMRTVTGSLSAADIRADSLSMRTVSGGILLERAAARRLKSTTVGADVTLDLEETPEHVDINSVSGDTTLSVPADALAVSLRAVTGKLRTAGITRTEDAPAVTATSVSGDLIVTRREGPAEA